MAASTPSALTRTATPSLSSTSRAVNENVINQGLFYLDWMLDHKGAFKVLVAERLGQEAADSVDRSSPRLLCVAGGLGYQPIEIRAVRYRGNSAQQMGEYGREAAREACVLLAYKLAFEKPDLAW